MQELSQPFSIYMFYISLLTEEVGVPRGLMISPRQGVPWMEEVERSRDELWTAPRGGTFAMSLMADYFLHLLIPL